MDEPAVEVSVFSDSYLFSPPLSSPYIALDALTLLFFPLLFFCIKDSLVSLSFQSRSLGINCVLRVLARAKVHFGASSIRVPSEIYISGVRAR